MDEKLDLISWIMCFKLISILHPKAVKIISVFTNNACYIFWQLKITI